MTIGCAGSSPAPGTLSKSISKIRSAFLFSLGFVNFEIMESENYFVYVISSEVANKFYVGMPAGS